jgi:hypothetical protein
MKKLTSRYAIAIFFAASFAAPQLGYAQATAILSACRSELSAKPPSSAPKVYAVSILGCAERATANSARTWQYDLVQAIAMYYLGSLAAGDHMRGVALAGFDADKSIVAKRDELRASIVAQLDEASASGRAIETANDVKVCLALATQANIPVKQVGGGILWDGLIAIDRAATLAPQDLQLVDALKDIRTTRFSGDTQRMLQQLDTNASQSGSGRSLRQTNP